jgi:ATP-dependent Clp protease ATP-binding subunit ClpA
MVGSPPGYVGHEDGGQLTELVRRRPYSVILFDEIEKAHPDVWNMFLQILDEGRLTDAKGRKVNFKNTVIIMTSNIGSDAILESGKRKGSIGFSDGEETAQDTVRERVMALLHERFKPEFLNRLDDIIVFRSLSKDDIGSIVDIHVQRVIERLKQKRITLHITPAAKAFIAKKGFDPAFGARPLKRTLQQEILDRLALDIIEGTIRENDSVRVDVKKDAITLTKE